MRILPQIHRLSDEGGQGWLLDVRCPCGRSGWIPPAQLAARVGWDTALDALPPRLRCTACGAKGLTIAAISAPRARGIPKNPH
jgi:hypothetical protein